VTSLIKEFAKSSIAGHYDKECLTVKMENMRERNDLQKKEIGNLKEEIRQLKDDNTKSIVNKITDGPSREMLECLLVVELKDLMISLDKNVVLSKYKLKEQIITKLLEDCIMWEHLKKNQIVKMISHVKSSRN
jgi:hypothetical protein